MEMGLANKGIIMNFNSIKMVKDGIRVGEIPEWLIMEFLVRLPQKVVFRFKLVSKQWLSIVVDPNFVKMYCSRALETQKLQPWTFISAIKDHKYNPFFKVLKDIYSSNLKLGPSLLTLPLPRFQHPQGKGYMIYGASNGFVLYGLDSVIEKEDFDDPFDLRICNPVTGQWITLPPNGSWKEYVCCGFMTNIEDGVLMNYTVVRLDVYDRNQSNFLTCEVFLSEVGSWRKYIVPFDRDFADSFNTSCIILNGVMHWGMLLIHGTRLKHELLAYDPYKQPDRVRFIAKPGKLSDAISSICDVHEEQLRYFEGSHTPLIFSVWVLNNYDSGDWVLQHRVNFDDIHISKALSGQDFSEMRPISFHPYDSDVVYLGYERMIISYNMKTRKLEKEVEKVRGKTKFTDFGYHLFLIPPWPISLSRLLLKASED